MKRFLLLCGAAALAACGCFKFEQDMTINDDGSADATIHYAMSEQTIAQLEAMKQGNPNAQQGPSFDEAKIKEQFEKQKAQGVELKSVKVESKDGWKHVTVAVHSKSVGAAARAASQQGQDNKEMPFSLLKKGDNYELCMGGGDKAGGMGDAANPEQKAQQQKMMKGMMAGMRMSIKLTVPGEVVETNAHEKSGKTVSWLLDIDNDPKFFDKMETLGKQGMVVTFKGAGLNLPEIKPAPKAADPEPAE